MIIRNSICIMYAINPFVHWVVSIFPSILRPGHVPPSSSSLAENEKILFIRKHIKISPCPPIPPEAPPKLTRCSRLTSRARHRRAHGGTTCAPYNVDPPSAPCRSPTKIAVGIRQPRHNRDRARIWSLRWESVVHALQNCMYLIGQ